MRPMAENPPVEGDEERVVPVDHRGAPIGEALKHDVHTTETPLHLAFSCYLFNDVGELLITRRALSKKTWPGVWTNSFCGHPSPGEKQEDALRRRAAHELGAAIGRLDVALPDFRYRAVDAGGVVENEVCPVYIATLSGALHPNPDEVAEWRWVQPEDLAVAVARAPYAFSPWSVRQIAALDLTRAAGRS